MPQANYEEKKTLANWINDQLRTIGLAIRCPRSGQPSLLQPATTRDHETGRFRLDYVDEHGHHRNPSSFADLSGLTLMPESLSVTPFRSRGGRNR